MKMKLVIILALVFFTLCSISTIYADTFNMGNSTFSLPDGYTRSEKDNQIVLFNDEYVLTMY